LGANVKKSKTFGKFFVNKNNKHHISTKLPPPLFYIRPILFYKIKIFKIQTFIFTEICKFLDFLFYIY